MTMDHQPEPPPGWERCPPGEVARLGKKLRGRKSRRMFLRTAAAAVAVAVVGGGVLLIWPGRRDDVYHYGGIACSEVQRLGQDYMTGRVGEPEKSRIAEHVARCPRCGPMFQQMG